MEILAAEIKKGFFYIITYFLGKVKCGIAYVSPARHMEGSVSIQAGGI